VSVEGQAEAATAARETRVALVGLPGSGKSTVGLQLSRRLQLPFVDSDRVIETRIGGSIREFFDQHGEPAFRDLEEQVLAELCAGPSAVIATGGGAVLRPANRQHLREGCHVIYLRTTPESVFERLREDRQRPLLQVADPQARLKDLFAERDPLYREVAHGVVDTGRSRVGAVVNVIAMQLELDGLRPLGRGQ
jgi:shikimate kinase